MLPILLLSNSIIAKVIIGEYLKSKRDVRSHVISNTSVPIKLSCVPNFYHYSGTGDLCILTNMGDNGVYP